MAEDLNRRELTADASALAAPAPADEPILKRPPPEWESAPHAGRFLLAYGLLGLVLGATVVGLAIGLTRGGGSNAIPWSSWRPTASGTNEVDQIVSHVSDAYRLPTGRQIVAVIPRSPKIMEPPITTAAVDTQALFANEQQFNTYPLDNSLLFIFCGAGTKCAIGQGQPSSQQLRLLRREALELALYTFHFVHGVDSVVTFLPPNLQAKSNELQTALFFRKDQYSKLAQEPIATTLPGRPHGDVLPAGQADLVDRLTVPALYRYQLQRSSDGSSGVLIFSPVVPTS